MGVNVPNFGPGTAPGLLRRWAQTVEGLGFDLLMISDHIAVTPDVAEQYPPPFYEPFTTLAWLAGITDRIQFGTTVLIVPYRHPLLVARMAANLSAWHPLWFTMPWLRGAVDRPVTWGEKHDT
jgi:alkanesulfonate monooxygenase SsuD/methylene tetrahydromethanopterin reductase-like flavin-dependent oxidoreductase (luciferase family)